MAGGPGVVKVGDRFLPTSGAGAGRVVSLVDAAGEEYDEMNPGDVRALVVQQDEDGLYAVWQSRGLEWRRPN